MALLAAGSARTDDFGRCLPSVAPCGYTQPWDVGVLVEKPMGDGQRISQGSGVYMGHGLVLTAAHVVRADPGHPQVSVTMDDIRMPGTVALMNAMETVDLAVIRLDPGALAPAALARPGVAVCRYNPGADQPATVISQGQVTRTRTVPVSTRSAPGQASWSNMLMAGLHPGNSGGGVFDPTQGCLWGIVVQEITGRTAPGGPSFDYTAFIGAADVWRFLSRFRG